MVIVNHKTPRFCCGAMQGDPSTRMVTFSTHFTAHKPDSQTVKRTLVFDDQDTIIMSSEREKLAPSITELLNAYDRFVPVVPDNAVDTSILSKSKIEMNSSPVSRLDSVLLPPKRQNTKRIESEASTIDFEENFGVGNLKTMELSMTDDFDGSGFFGSRKPPTKSRLNAVQPKFTSDEDTFTECGKAGGEIDTEIIMESVIKGDRIRFDLDDRDRDARFASIDFQFIIRFMKLLPRALVRKATDLIRNECTRLRGADTARTDSRYYSVLRKDSVCASWRKMTCIHLFVEKYKAIQYDLEFARKQAVLFGSADSNPSSKCCKYLQLKNTLPFMVTDLRRRARVRIGEENRVFGSANEVHAMIGIRQRWKFFRQEFLELMKLVHGVTYDQTFLSFCVSSMELRMRFSVVLRVPPSYPWCGIAISRINIEFGGDPEEVMERVRGIASQIPVGERWLTRFVNCVLDQFRV
jgi:hypothetical protein